MKEIKRTVIHLEDKEPEKGVDEMYVLSVELNASHIDIDPEWKYKSNESTKKINHIIDRYNELKNLTKNSGFLIVLPEYSFEYSSIAKFKEISAKDPNLVIVVGTVFDKLNTTFIIYKGKENPYNKVNIKGDEIKQNIKSGQELFVFKNTPIGNFTVLTCSDAISEQCTNKIFVPNHHIDLLIIPSWHDNINSFDNTLGHLYSQDNFNHTKYIIYTNMTSLEPKKAGGKSTIYGKLHLDYQLINKRSGIYSNYYSNILARLENVDKKDWYLFSRLDVNNSGHSRNEPVGSDLVHYRPILDGLISKKINLSEISMLDIPTIGNEKKVLSKENNKIKPSRYKSPNNINVLTAHEAYGKLIELIPSAKTLSVVGNLCGYEHLNPDTQILVLDYLSKVEDRLKNERFDYSRITTLNYSVERNGNYNVRPLNEHLFRHLEDALKAEKNISQVILLNNTVIERTYAIVETENERHLILFLNPVRMPNAAYGDLPMKCLYICSDKTTEDITKSYLLNFKSAFNCYKNLKTCFYINKSEDLKRLTNFTQRENTYYDFELLLQSIKSVFHEQYTSNNVPCDYSKSGMLLEDLKKEIKDLQFISGKEESKLYYSIANQKFIDILCYYLSSLKKNDEYIAISFRDFWSDIIESFNSNKLPEFIIKTKTALKAEAVIKRSLVVNSDKINTAIDTFNSLEKFNYKILKNIFVFNQRRYSQKEINIFVKYYFDIVDIISINIILSNIFNKLYDFKIYFTDESITSGLKNQSDYSEKNLLEKNYNSVIIKKTINDLYKKCVIFSPDESDGIPFINKNIFLLHEDELVNRDLRTLFDSKFSEYNKIDSFRNHDTPKTEIKKYRRLIFDIKNRVETFINEYKSELEISDNIIIGFDNIASYIKLLKNK